MKKPANDSPELIRIRERAARARVWEAEQAEYHRRLAAFVDLLWKELYAYYGPLYVYIVPGQAPGEWTELEMVREGSDPQQARAELLTSDRVPRNLEKHQLVRWLQKHTDKAPMYPREVPSGS